MAVTTRSINGRHEHFGLSSDTKPTTDIGAKFLEVDTGNVYTFSGSAWFRSDVDSPGGGVYNETPPTLDDGERTAVQLTANGSVKAAEAEIESRSFADALVSVSLVVKNASGYLMSLYGVNRNAGVRYLQVHNLAATPADQAVPVMSFSFPTATQREIGDSFFGRGGRAFDTGITLAWSTTAATYTAATASEHDMFASYA